VRRHSKLKYCGGWGWHFDSFTFQHLFYPIRIL